MRKRRRATPWGSTFLVSYVGFALVIVALSSTSAWRPGSYLTSAYVVAPALDAVLAPAPGLGSNSALITTLLADVNGDGKDDVIQVYPAATYVRLSTGTGFDAARLWSNVPFYGTKATLAAELTGDGDADLIAINGTSTWVMTSTGTAFNPPQPWLDVPFYGTRATLAGTGVVGRIEAVNDDSSWKIGIVVHSRAPVLDSDVPFYGDRATLLGDFSGDGYLDLIAVNSGSTWVMESPRGDPTSFGPPQLTSIAPFYGTRATLAGDVNGDGLADLVAVNDSSTWLMIAGATTFSAPRIASNVPFYGSQTTVMADVDGDGLVDLVAINGDSIWVMTSKGASFNPPAPWG